MRYYVIKADDGTFQAAVGNGLSSSQKRKAVAVYGSNLAASKKADTLNGK